MIYSLVTKFSHTQNKQSYKMAFQLLNHYYETIFYEKGQVKHVIILI